MKKLLLLLLLMPNLVMGEKVHIEGVGIVEFEDGMTAEEIEAAIENNILPLAAKEPPVPEPIKPSKAENDCYIEVAQSAEINSAVHLGRKGCILKHRNSFFSSKRALGKCYIEVAQSAEINSAVHLGRKGCNSKHKD